MDRRTFGKNLLAGIASYALMDSLFASEAILKKIEPITKHWAIELNEFCNDLKKQSITPLEWQKQIERLYAKVELNELLRFVNFENLIKGFQYPDLGVNAKYIKFPKLSGLPERTVFIKKIFGMKKDRAIIPHGHSNMASAHLILKGKMHLRHYDKIRAESKSLIIKPSVNKILNVGQYSSISDDKDNVHWFIANTATAFTFDVIMLDLKGKKYDIQNIDIYAKQKLSDGTLRVPILDVQTALKKYGKLHH